MLCDPLTEINADANDIRIGAVDPPGIAIKVVTTAERPSEVGSTATGRIKYLSAIS